MPQVKIRNEEDVVTLSLTLADNGDWLRLSAPGLKDLTLNTMFLVRQEVLELLDFLRAADAEAYKNSVYAWQAEYDFLGAEDTAVLEAIGFMLEKALTT